MLRSFIHQTLGINKDMCSLHKTRWVMDWLESGLALILLFSGQDLHNHIRSWSGDLDGSPDTYPYGCVPKPFVPQKKRIRILRMKLGRHSPNNQLDHTA